MAILGLALALLLSMIAAARSRLLRSQDDWRRAHHVANAVEFYLLAGPDEPKPPELFPDPGSNGWDASCGSPEELPAGELDELSQNPPPGCTFVLRRLPITVTYHGEEMYRMTMEKIISEEGK